MSICIEIPDSIEQKLRNEMGNLEQATKEALAVEAYRTEKLSLGQFAELLNLGIYEADGLLKQRGIVLDYSDAELEEERQTLRNLVGP
jgi:predicted HTH domain antitoxin